MEKIEELLKDENFEEFLNHVKKEMDVNARGIFDEIQQELVDEDNERVIVLLIHINCEFFLNSLLMKNGFDLTRLSNFERNWNYNKKRELLWSKNIIDEKVNNDLMLINTIRNDLAHKLTPDTTKIQNNIKKFGDYSEFISKLPLARQTQFCMNNTLSYLINEMADMLSDGASVLLKKIEDSKD